MSSQLVKFQLKHLNLTYVTEILAQNICSDLVFLLLSLNRYLAAASFRLYLLHDLEEMLRSYLCLIVRNACSSVLDFQANVKFDQENCEINYGNIHCLNYV